MPLNLNLAPERGPNVWDKPPQAAEGPSTGYAVGGAVMLAAGAAAAFFGGRMLYRAVRSSRERALDDADAARGLIDVVDEESAQSFPASDAPSWTATDGATLDRRRQR